ncbi:hypothetical protein GCM10027186_46410 [Micromonospora schwarzwaldensis]
MPQSAINTRATADTTAPIRPDLRCPGLCWSGAVTGSSPATVGPSLAIGSPVSLARRVPGPAQGPTGRGRTTRAGDRRPARRRSDRPGPLDLFRGGRPALWASRDGDHTVSGSVLTYA